MRKIAIPVIDGKLSAHFGHAPYFYFYHAENDKVVKEQMETPPPHEFGVIPNWLAENNVTDLITGGIGPKAVEILNQNNINVFTGAPANEPAKVVDAFLSGTLKTTANMCNHNAEDHEHNCEH
ncbi:MAG: ATPase [Chlorobi bacterium]|nr:ATPase [Chlorobiota bacterium]